MMAKPAEDKAIFAQATPAGNQLWARLQLALLYRVHLLGPIVRFFPVIRWRGTLYAFSYDAVQSVLGNDPAFPIPFTQRMSSLDCTGALSILGFDDDAEYRKNLCQIMQSMKLEDLADVSRQVAAQAERIVSAAPGRLDAISGLLTPIVLDVAQDYFGVRFEDPNALHCWTMAISNYTFGGDKPPANLDIAAHAGGRLMDKELNAAIERTPRVAGQDGTFLLRLAAMSGAEAMSNNQIRATIAGLLSGFLPNLPAAGYNVLQIFLERPDAMRIAREAALADDDDLLERCIKEALRLRPLDPGRRRLCVNQNAPGIPAPGWLGRLFPAPRNAYANTLLAMSDSQRIRKPNGFDPYRPASDNLAFGFGKHYCVGAPFALCLLVQGLKPLLRKPGLRRSIGAPPSFLFLQFFPRNLDLSFDVAKP